MAVGHVCTMVLVVVGAHDCDITVTVRKRLWEEEAEGGRNRERERGDSACVRNNVKK